MPDLADEQTLNVPTIPAIDLTALAQAIGASARASAVFGEPVSQGRITLVPIARAAWGLGRGGAGARNGGGGMRMEPVGFIEIKDGVATFRPIQKKWRIGLPLGLAALALTVGARTWSSRSR
jgi:hypothetical protein